MGVTTQSNEITSNEVTTNRVTEKNSKGLKFSNLLKYVGSIIIVFVFFRQRLDAGDHATNN